MSDEKRDEQRDKQKEMMKSFQRRFFDQAMSNGLRLGLFFVLQAVGLALFQLGFISSLLFLVGLGGVLAFLVIQGKSFRDDVLGGRIRYSQSVAYLSWSYLFALIIAAVAFYFSFKHLFQSPAFYTMMEESFELLEQAVDPEVTDTLRENLEHLTPGMAMRSTIFSSFTLGILYILIISIFIRRK